MAAQKQDFVRICTQEFLPGQVSTPVGNLIQKNPHSPLSLTVKRDIRWINGSRIKVRFLNPPSDLVKNKVKIYGQLWEKVANITFEWVESGDADIRIGFRWQTRQGDGNTYTDEGSWSYMGTESRYIADQTQPTMHYGWLYDHTPDHEYARTVIHEFGHALGCAHEHQNPSANILWNEAVVYAATADWGWSKEKTDHNILKRLDTTGYDYTNFDPDSIMIYEYPASWVRNSQGSHSNFALSELDKALIRKMYPTFIKDIGTYFTTETRTWYPPVSMNRAAISFPSAYETAPNVTVGLCQVDMDHSYNYRIEATATTITNNGFDLNMDSWADSKLYAAGATWLKTLPNDPRIDCGQFYTLEIRPDITADATIIMDGPVSWQRDVKRCNFTAGKFSSPPKVVVWLKALDTQTGKNVRIWARAKNVTSTGFDLTIDSWADSKVYYAAASWFAHDASKTDIQSGAVSTQDYRNWYPAQTQNGGNVTFGAGFNKTPQVFVALSMIDMDSSTNLRLVAGANGVTAQGFNWTANTYADSLCYQAGVHWIALA